MNKSVMIGIIGINGNFGQWLREFFEGLHYRVIGSDVKTKLTNQNVVEDSDVVVFSVPPRVSVNVIREMVPFSREDQLWLDITSLKERQTEAMLASRAEVIGLHPMFAPVVKTWKGQTVIVCLGRGLKWHKWILDILDKTQANIKIANSDVHDEKMSFVQGLPHAVHLIMAAVLREMNVDIEDSLTYTSPFYRIAWSLIGRILAQSPELYADIQILNRHTLSMLGSLEKEVKRFREIVASGNLNEFERQFIASREHFGGKNIQEAFELFSYVIHLMTDLDKNKSIVLQIKEDRPGILHEISGIFVREGINLTAIHSFKTGAGFKFLVGLDEKTYNSKVKKALLRIKEESIAVVCE